MKQTTKNVDNSKFMICITDIIIVTKHASWRLSALSACFGWVVLIDAVVQRTMQFNLNRKRIKLKRRVFEQPYLEMMKLDDSHNGRHCRSPCYSVDVRVSRPMCFPSPGGPAIAASQQRVVASVAVYLGLRIGWTASPQTGCHPAERRYLPVITNTASTFL